MTLIEVLDIFSQIVITCCGFFSIYLMASQEARIRKRGAIIGLISEPFWFITAYVNDQYGIMALCVVYGINWIRAYWKNRNRI